MGIAGLSRAVFLDRDGVLNDVRVADGVPHPPSRVEDLVILPGVREACDVLRSAGYRLFSVTNQPDVARGAQSRERVEEMNARIRDTLDLDGIAVCYHDDSDGCECRKPKPGLLLSIARDEGVDLDQSFMIGDRWRDVAAGHAAGCRAILIDRGYAEGHRCNPDWTVLDLRAASEVILSLQRGS